MRASFILVLLPASLAAYGGIIYYRLAWLHLQSRRALRHVDLQLGNHHEQIPKLLSALSNYVHHETEVIERVMLAQLQSLAAHTVEERMAASTNLSRALHRLMRVAEHCHELHVDDEAALIHMQVVLAEQKIALAREYYNEVIKHYNARLEQFPHNIMARIGGFRRLTPFEFPEHLTYEYASAEC